MSIHPTAIISPKAELGRNVSIGPYSIVGDDVILHDDIQVASHCVIEGPSEFGSGSVFFPFVSAGQAPQDLKYKGERSWLRAGERNTSSIRPRSLSRPLCSAAPKGAPT